MPMPFNAAVMTNDGAALLNKAQAGECSIAFTAMAIGNGVYTDDEKSVSALQAMTSLKSLKNKYDITKTAINTETSVKATAVLSNEDPSTGEAVVTDGYYINEIGLYAKEKDADDDAEILYSIAVTSGDEGDYMPPYNGYNPAEIEQDYYATVDNSANVTLVVHNEIYALQDDVDAKTKELQEQITELNNALVPNYAGQTILLEERGEGAFTGSITMDSEGWISGFCANSSESSSMFMRIIINDVNVVDAHSNQLAYTYLRSAIFPVKTGDVVEYDCSPNSSAGSFFIYFIPRY